MRWIPIALLLASTALAKDVAPNGCIDCHSGNNKLSVSMKKIDAKALQAFASKGVTLKGKHPPVTGKDVPSSCLRCHTATSKIAPPLPAMMHGIHVVKGKPPVECTSCHKIGANGVPTIPNGNEK